MTAVGLDRWPRFVAAAQERAIEVAAADLPDVTPVPLVDDYGQVVISPLGKEVLRPAGLDPHFFVAQGLRNREMMGAVMGSGSITGTLIYEFGAL